MKNKAMVILFFLFGIVIFATPHFPEGIPSIGPLKGGETFWGTDVEGNYIDGVTYHADYNIEIPKYGQVQVKIGATEFYSGGGKAETSVLFILKKPMDGFTGEININTVNSGGKTIIKNYKGYSDRSGEYMYNAMFDFSDADANSRVTVEFLLNDGKKLSVKLKKVVSQDWIFISQKFPVTK